jgi:ceramide glucosyltransferase
MVIFWIFSLAACIGVIGYLAQIIAVRKTISHKDGNPDNTETQSERALPPISILKPMKGLDDNLFDNLDSFCRQDYPCYELIFSLQDYNDPAYKIAAKIKDRHPDKDISIVVEKCEVGLNPKVNNMIPAYRTAKYEHILISDSNVMVGPEYLRALSIKMTEEGVGLVSSLIRGVQGRTLGSALENLHLNSFIAGSVCFLDRFLNMPCVIGKSMLMRKKDLELIGGLRSV